MTRHELYQKFALERILIPATVLKETETFLKSHGVLGHEGMVLWIGEKKGREAAVTSCIHPKQKCTVVSYDIPIEESQAINLLLADKREVIIAQVHSHPGEAFHSSRDDAMPFTYSIGFLSLVVPNFCDQPLRDFSCFRIWEHIGAGNWAELSKDDIEMRFILKGQEE